MQKESTFLVTSYNIQRAGKWLTGCLLVLLYGLCMSRTAIATSVNITCASITFTASGDPVQPTQTGCKTPMTTIGLICSYV